VKSNLTSFAHLEEEEKISPVIFENGEELSPPAENNLEEQALKIVQKNILYSLGIVLIPVPVIDVTFSVAVQINMIQKLSALYGVSFSEHTVKNIVSSMISGFGAVLLGRIIFSSLLKLIPGGALFAALVSNPLAFGAVTYAFGKIFIMHFEANGTLLDFDPQKMKRHFRKEFQEGLNFSKSLRQNNES